MNILLLVEYYLLVGSIQEDKNGLIIFKVNIEYNKLKEIA